MFATPADKEEPPESARVVDIESPMKTQIETLPQKRSPIKANKAKTKSSFKFTHLEGLSHQMLDWENKMKK